MRGVKGLNGSILKTEHLTKRFIGLVANDDISLELNQNKILAIIGENGAGKSTFCKMITGVYQPDEGSIYLSGKKIRFKNAKESMSAGIGMVYQERNLIPMLTGAQNICLGTKGYDRFFLNEKKIMSMALDIMHKININVPLDVPVEKLGAGEQQLIEIMRALRISPRVLILDEPTASLGEGEIGPFLQFVKNMTKTIDIAVIFISHKIEEVFSVADDIAVFTDGRNVMNAKKEEITQEQCIMAMLRNGEIKPIEVKDKGIKDSETILKVESGCYDGKKHSLNISLKKGEVTGFYGLVGSGRTEFAEALIGLRKASLTGYMFNNQPVYKPTPGQMIKKGMIMTSEKRANGIFRTLSISDNVCNLFLEKRLTNNMGFVNKEASRHFTTEVLNKNNVKYTSTNQTISDLSGGNIQKVIIGRSVETEGIKLLILDEPTVGMDIGAKNEVYKKCRSLAEENDIALMFISSELEELLVVCNKIYVFANGNVIDCFRRKDFIKARILETAIRGKKI